jgi:hypothetical protein
LPPDGLHLDQTQSKPKACQEKTGLPIDGEYECEGSPAAAISWITSLQLTNAT